MAAADNGDARPVLIVGGPPTSNGDLHIGHVAGPYVGADVHVRYLRAAGRQAVFASCTDDYQTYVVTTAARLGVTPPELVAESTALIESTFKAMGIDLDGFSPTDDGYRSNVLDYVGRLHAKGKFVLRTVRLPYSERTGRFLVEGMIGGDCPTCLADSRGGFCEACGHPIDFDGLIEPYSLLDRHDPITYREAEILVFPLEEYRDQLSAYYEARAATWRPHLVTLVRELLARPLPDYPVTYPVEWGLPAPFPETPGQTINAWMEGMPASMYCLTYAQRRSGLAAPTADHAMLAENDGRFVVFMGFDPLFVWALVHVAELMAHEGRYVLPENFLCNEFYELENQKFSTSMGHVVWARDLVSEVPRDVVRFYLCRTAPEHAKTNFSRAALDEVVGSRLTEPWNELSAILASLTARADSPGMLWPVSPQARAWAAAMAARFSQCFELSSFSLNRAADLVTQNLERLLLHAQRAANDDLANEVLCVRIGDLFLQLRALITCAAPILIDLAARTAEAGDFELRISADAFDLSEINAFSVPQLSLRTATAGDNGLLSSATTTV